MHIPVIERIRKYYQIPNASIFMESRRPDEKHLKRRMSAVWGLAESIIRHGCQARGDQVDDQCESR